MPVDETQLIHEPAWRERAESRALVKWRKPRQRALIRALATGVQLLEDTALDLVTSTTIEGATGASLDQWGELVGEQRGGLNDNEYLPMILARMLINRSAGTRDNLIEIFDAITEPNIDIWYLNNYPAGLYLVVVRAEQMGEVHRRRVARMMESARPAGRHMTLIEALPGYFGFEDGYSSEGYDIGPYSRLIP